jgi:chromosome partitioning protein
MYVIAAVATKGGGGKTTLVSCLAVLAASEGKNKVGLLDLDPQRSLADWWQRRGEPDNPQLYKGIDSALDAISALKGQGLDYLFIDTGPGLLEALEQVIEGSDLVIVPLKSSSFDIVAVQPVLDEIFTAGNNYLCVFNECISPKMDSTGAAALHGALHPVANTFIKQRVAYRSAQTTGNTGPERDPKCDEEIRALWKEIKSLRRKQT